MTTAVGTAKRRRPGDCLDGPHPTEPGYLRCAPCRAGRRERHRMTVLREQLADSAWQRRLARCTTWAERITAALETAPSKARPYREIAVLLTADPQRVLHTCWRLYMSWRLDRVGEGIYALRPREDQS